jgi:predicted O-methyltransferase YrrM
LGRETERPAILSKMKILLRKIYDNFVAKNKLISESLIRIYYYSGYPIFIFNILRKKPYIGSYLFSDQEKGRERLKVIGSVFKNIQKKQINILELGVYCGQSTLFISSLIKKGQISYYCVDIFKEFEISDSNNDFHYKKIYENLKNKKIYNLFFHNINAIKKSQSNINFFIKKITTKTFFKHNKIKFDLIIIDASHQFNYVYEDIISSKKILNNNGYIIGDDYESEAKTLSFFELKKNKNTDLIYNKKNKKYFHPGVTLAVKYIFKNLKSKNGLFCVQKKNKKFIDFFDKKKCYINKVRKK